MWRALHDQGIADQRHWEMALRHVRRRECAACQSRPVRAMDTLSPGLSKLDTDPLRRTTA
jgi:hypothetical protein